MGEEIASASPLKSNQPFLRFQERAVLSGISIQCESRRGCGTARSRRTEVAVAGRAGGDAGGRQERVVRSRREEVKLHGLAVAESAEVDFTLALVTAGDTGDEQG